MRPPLELTIAEYHADREHTSNSRLRDFRDKGAAYYHARYVAGTLPDRKPTPAMKLGVAFEDLVQRPEAFKRDWIVKPKFTGKGSKAAREAWEAEHENVATLDQDDHDMLYRMAEQVYALCASGAGPAADAKRWLVQPTYRATLSGVRCQSRPDWAYEGGTVDLKTIESLDDIDRSIANYGYHTQGVLAQGCVAGDFDDIADLDVQASKPWLLFVEKQDSHRACFVELDLQWLAHARSVLARDLALLRQCQATGLWPRTWERVVISSPPPWIAP